MAYGDEGLFSGSADRTIDQWSLATGYIRCSFLRHDAEITALAICQDGESEFLFTGGKDGAVHAWDLTRKRPMFELGLGDHWYPTALMFVAARMELFILSTVDHEGPPPESVHWKLQSYVFRPQT
jgi:WD40 repeat protein